MAFLVSPLTISRKQDGSKANYALRAALATSLLGLALLAFIKVNPPSTTSLDEEGIVDYGVYAPAMVPGAASNPLYPPPPAAQQPAAAESQVSEGQDQTEAASSGDEGEEVSGSGTGNGASAASATAAYGSSASSGQDFTVADYDRLKFERRQALDFCEAHFSAMVNIQKCIFELFKNARY